MSLAYAGMPNMFVFNGPGSPVGNGSVVPAIETEGEYMIQCIDKIMKHDVKSMCIKEAAVDEFALHSDAWMPRMVSSQLSGNSQIDLLRKVWTDR
jgi:hypothetical protein